MQILKRLWNRRKEKNNMFGNLDVFQAKELINDNKELVLLDIREKWEFDIAHIKGCELFPLSQFKEKYHELERDKTYIVYCHTGGRSQSFCQYLAQQGFGNLYNLKGGVHAWALKIDNSLKTY